MTSSNLNQASGVPVPLGTGRHASLPDGLPWRRRASHPPMELVAGGEAPWRTPPRPQGPDEGGAHPHGASPAFVRTLLSRKSWFLDADGPGGLGLGYAQQGTAAAARRAFSDVETAFGDARGARWTSSTIDEGEGPGAAGVPGGSSGGVAPGVRWSDSGTDEGGGEGAGGSGPGLGPAPGSQPGMSPTPELLLERRVLSRKSLTPLASVGEASAEGSSPSASSGTPLSTPFAGQPRFGESLAPQAPAGRADSGAAAIVPDSGSARSPSGAAAIPGAKRASQEAAGGPRDANPEGPGTPEPPPRHQFGQSPTPELMMQRRASARRSSLGQALPSVDEGASPRVTVGFPGNTAPHRRHSSDVNRAQSSTQENAQI